MRVLVTNDDGVDAPGIAALATAVHRSGADTVVVAPLENASGAGAAVGPVHGRGSIAYERRRLRGLEELPAFGVDGPPALAVILACVGAFGPRPDLVLSGVNHGVNVGRSVLHSGTVGAALTAAHFGLRALAVSLRFGPPPEPWETATTLAVAAMPDLAAAPAGTVWSLNVPDVPLTQLAGVRRARLGRAATIRAATHDGACGPEAADPGWLPEGDGTLRLDLVRPATPGQPSGSADADSDAAVVAANLAALTPLVGVREATDDTTEEFLGRALVTLQSACPRPPIGPQADLPAT
ncbi:5'/3'-nucleotidase SurE [Aciditerrimonas ferrireducens]|jgi:5'-nucleotidase|uniref:5'-nucleotidase n=1 Tax=Aciditerrimonas ferrireducens TaxID=667306 RepID=A0ABV6C1X3_9ACTN|nr:5'/3'-nucleotidase SurE [Aciditerrimonas ferrireducens]MCK4176445.1 5'/3'-nucleotidase SurE [Aciditerrimonas ferrireducens]